MRAMILAAGRGERMRPLTDRIPKPLLTVRGKALIVWLIEALARAGIRDLVINHAHLGAALEAALGDGARLHVNIRYSPEGAALETAGGIANALPLLGAEPFMVVNGDIFCDFDFAALAQRSLGADLAHVVLVANPPQHPRGDFLLHGGRVQDRHDSGDTSDSGDMRTFAGIGLYDPRLFDGIVRGSKASLAPLLRNAMATGRVSGEFHAGAWHDVGTPERLRQLDLGA